MRFAVLLSTSLMVALMIVAVEPVMPAIRDHFGGSTQTDYLVRAIQSLPAAPLAICLLFAGWPIDRFGGRVVLIAGLIVFGLAGVAPFFLENLWAIVGSRALLGAGLAAVSAATLALIGDYFDTAGRTRLFAAQGITTAAGIAAVGAASGQLALHGWHTPFLLFLVSFVIAAAAWLGLPRQPRKAGAGARATITWEVMRSPWIGGCYLVAAVAGTFGFVFPTQMPFMMQHAGFGDPRQIGMVMGGGAGLGAAASFILVPLLVRLLSVPRIFGVLFGVMAASFLIAALVQGMPALFAAGVLCSAAGITVPPIASLTVLSRAPEAVRGQSVSLLAFASSIGQFTSTALSQPLIATIGYEQTFTILGTGLFVAALPFLASAKGPRLSLGAASPI